MSFFYLGLSVRNSPLSLSSAPLAELCGSLEFRLASSHTVGARLPPPFALDRFFRRNSGVDAGIIEIGSVKCIRIHDLRHSHISLLIDMGFSAVAIADRVGHESIDITYRYAHLFPSRQVDMADRLNNERKEEMEHVS